MFTHLQAGAKQKAAQCEIHKLIKLILPRQIQNGNDKTGYLWIIFTNKALVTVRSALTHWLDTTTQL